MSKQHQQRKLRDNNSANKCTMLQKLQQRHNDDSINNNNEIDMSMINCIVSKILMELNHMTHAITTINAL